MSASTAAVRQNRYRITALLGQGGMGTVYRAWDLRLDVSVAIKEMVPQPGLDDAMLAGMRRQFRQEATVLARLNHPSLVNVTDFFEEDGNVYLVMRFIEGESLAQRIAQRGPLPETQVIAWAEQLLDALAYCHGEGVLHRDIKPQNIILRPDGQAVLVDFGLVKLWDPGDPQTRTALRGMGTPEYAPPEQYSTLQQHTDARSDLYSLGATLYHALTGQVPLSASDRMATPEQFKPPRELAADLSPVLESAVMQALALPLDSRFRDAQQMRVALVARRTSPSPPPTRRLRMPAGLLAVGAVVTLALCGVSAWGAANAVGPALARIGAARTAGSVAPAPTATSTAAAQDVVASPTAPPAATSTASGSPPLNAATAPTLTASTPVPTATAPTPSIASPTATHTPVPMVAYEPVTLDAVANATQGFAAPPTGELTLGGVPFRLTERIVQTQAEPATHSTFPTRVRLDLAIPGATHVHLLLTTGNGFRDFAGSAIGEVLAYCDGTAAHLSTLVLGQDIREWHSQPNVVATAPRAQEVWTGPIAGTTVQGRIDLLSLDLPAACRSGALTAVEVVDRSTETVGSRDPALNLTGVTVQAYR